MSAYGDDFLERHQQAGKEDPDTGGRSPFARDRDRILYSSAFRALGGKTQVVASTELGYLHNRLTHSLKVAQIGRALAARLSNAGSGVDPDLVEAACLAHDIGHPPFGHAGEQALDRAVEGQRAAEHDQLNRERLQAGEPEALKPEIWDGFEGNAQNLRVVTRLATHRLWMPPGLHLTRATLVAMTKYPWLRSLSAYDGEKWGAYEGDREALEWTLSVRPADVTHPVEEQILDWADDVTYAVHDVEDWYRLGLIPLHELFQFRRAADHPKAGTDVNPALEALLDWVEKKWNARGREFDRAEIVRHLHFLDDRVAVEEAFDGTRVAKGRIQATVTDLICFFTDPVTVEGGVAYEGRLIVPEDRKLLCNVLKELVWFYVIEKPGLAAQQHGQARIVAELVDWTHEDPERLLPADRWDEYQLHDDMTRAIADHVASLTEPMAINLHGKLSGTNLGAITDTM